MKKILTILTLLIAFSISTINAQIAETVYDTTNVTITDINAFSNDSTTTYIGYDSTYTYEVGVTFNNDTTADSLSITRSINNGYLYSLADSAFIYKIVTEDNVPAILTLDTTNNCLYINFQYGTVDTIGDNCDTLLITTYFVDMTYTIPNPTSVENTVTVVSYDMWTENTNVAITHAEGELISIYDANGRLIVSNRATSDIEYYTLKSGVYFVNIGKYTSKIVIR